MRISYIFKLAITTGCTMAVDKIAVLGGGNGAHAMAAELSLKGHKVNMYELPLFKEKFKETLKRKAIEICGDCVEGVAELNKVTVDIKEAIEGTQLIMITVPSFGQRTFAETCASHLEDGQRIILFTGNLGAIEFHRILKNKSVKKDVIIAETNTLPYGARLIEPTKVKVFVKVKSFLQAAAFPAKNTRIVIKTLKEIYPATETAVNVLEAFLNNVNYVDHCAPQILNTGCIENTKEFYYTNSVEKVLKSIDEERLALCKTLGFKQVPCEEWYLRTGYLSELAHELESSDVFRMSMKSRYLAEDVPYGLVPAASLGDMFGVQTPTMKAIIHLASVINQIDYWRKGRTVKKLGIAGLSIERLREYLEEGAGKP